MKLQIDFVQIFWIELNGSYNQHAVQSSSKNAGRSGQSLSPTVENASLDSKDVSNVKQPANFHVIWKECGYTNDRQ
ncbi:hypothetical protein P5673_011494, partial [Acropora cervicornis]